MTREQIAEKVAWIIAGMAAEYHGRTIEPGQVFPSDTLVMHGIDDHLALIEFTYLAEEALGIAVSDDLLDNDATVATLERLDRGTPSPARGNPDPRAPPRRGNGFLPRSPSNDATVATLIDRITDTKPTGDGAVNGPALATSPSGPTAATGNGSTPFEYELLAALQAIRAGDFSVRMSGEQVGARGRIVETFNEIAAANQRMAQQLERVGQDVGRDGRTRQRVKLGVPSGAWGEMENSINTLIDDLLWPTSEVTRVVAAVAKGDLLQTVRLDVDGRPLKGEFLQAATIVNTMIKQLSVFTSEVTRVAREVGTEGKLGGQAQVNEVTGVWKELTESVNSMAEQSHRAGPQHRRCDDRCCEWRFVQENYCRRARRNPPAQRSHQYDGGSAPFVRVGSDARCARGRH